jgi:uncharacterized protein YrrD
MRKGKDVVGKPVIAYDTGEKIETIIDLIFDQDENRLLGFLIDEGGWFSNAKVLPLSFVKAIGADAVIIPSKDAIAPSSQYETIHKILENNNILNGTRIMTTDGRDLGTLVDFYFDQITGAVEGYEASGGLFADAYSGRSFVPAPQTLKIGEDVAFVPAQTADLMEEQVGGLKAVMQTAGEKIQETAQVAGEKIQETAQVAGDKLQETGERLQVTAQAAGEQLQKAGQSASAKLTDAIVEPPAQKAFAVGKVALHAVDAPDGGELVRQGEVITVGMTDAAEHLEILDQLYRAAGGNLTAPLTDRMGGAVAGLTIEQAQGRRVQQVVSTLEGYIIAAPGQIVTPQVIERAKLNHQESALLDAVGLSTQGAVQSKASNLAAAGGDRLKSTTAIAGEQLQAGVTNLWDKVKETASDLQERSGQAIDEQRIKGALGRPTTRVILDTNDEVILNVGELITHKSIEDARSANILDVLLDSVYTETPKIPLEKLQAPGPSKSSL